MKRVRSVEKCLKRLKIECSHEDFIEKIAEECKINPILKEWTTFGLFNDIQKYFKEKNPEESIIKVTDNYCLRNQSLYIEFKQIRDVLIFHYNEIK